MLKFPLSLMNSLYKINAINNIKVCIALNEYLLQLNEQQLNLHKILLGYKRFRRLYLYVKLENYFNKLLKEALKITLY